MNRFFLTAIASAVGALLVVQSGCGPARTAATAKRDDRAKADPWVTLATAIREEVDAQASRQMLADLNSGLSTNPAAERPRLGHRQEAGPLRGQK